MDRTTTYRVYNKCIYAIGLYTDSTHSKSIDPGGFQLLTGDEILYAENIAKKNKFFAKKMLVIVDKEGNEVPLSDFNIVPNKKDVPHLDDEAIANALKMPNKKLEEFIDAITDASELDAIYNVAKEMDSLPKGKLQILQAKIPNKDWFN